MFIAAFGQEDSQGLVSVLVVSAASYWVDTVGQRAAYHTFAVYKHPNGESYQEVTSLAVVLDLSDDWVNKVHAAA